MIHWIVQLVFGAHPAQFESRYSVNESVSRLTAAVKPSVFHSLLGENAVGTVTESRVSIQRVIPFVGNAWKPFFIGSFQSADSKSVLIGHFRLSTFTRVAMSLWFGYIALWTVIAAVTVWTNSPSDLLVVLLGVGMFCAGIALVLTGKWFARNDVAWLTRTISEALGSPDRQL